ncbi:uncharacterized protein LOC118195592 isoform X2 [Stegodyphus dumicola]|nr:uncharacterized protein LOC118195592 isoform X2 [Stegodyphus dumicola]
MLKDIVVPSSELEEKRINRMEKADILEMTVNYLKKIHEKLKSGKLGILDERNSSRFFEKGYRLCMSEVQDFFQQSDFANGSSELLQSSIHLYLEEKLKSGFVGESCTATSHSKSNALDSKNTSEVSVCSRKVKPKLYHFNADSFETALLEKIHPETSNETSMSLLSHSSTDDDELDMPPYSPELPCSNSKSSITVEANINYEPLRKDKRKRNCYESMWRPW